MSFPEPQLVTGPRASTKEGRGQIVGIARGPKAGLWRGHSYVARHCASWQSLELSFPSRCVRMRWSLNRPDCVPIGQQWSPFQKRLNSSSKKVKMHRLTRSSPALRQVACWGLLSAHDTSHRESRFCPSLQNGSQCSVPSNGVWAPILSVAFSNPRNHSTTHVHTSLCSELSRCPRSHSPREQPGAPPPSGPSVKLRVSPVTGARE